MKSHSGWSFSAPGYFLISSSPNPHPSVFLLKYPSRSGHHFFPWDCLPPNPLLPLQGTHFLFRGNHLVTSGSSPRFEKLQKSNLKGGALGACFPVRHTHTTHPAHTHTNRHTEGLELEFIAMLINCSESQLNLPLSFHRSLYIINTQ